jgi:L-threonylcarbamoyladenylate synthase
MVPDYARPLLGLWPGGHHPGFQGWLIRAGGPYRRNGKDRGAAAGPSGGPGTAGQFGGPITGNQCQPVRRPAAARVMDLDPDVCRQVEMVLDAGTLAGGPVPPFWTRPAGRLRYSGRGRCSRTGHRGRSERTGNAN